VSCGTKTKSATSCSRRRIPFKLTFREIVFGLGGFLANCGLIPFGRKEFVSNPSGVVFSLGEIVFGLREILFVLKEIVSGRRETFSDLGEIVFGVRKFLSGLRQIVSGRRGIHPRPEKIVSAPKEVEFPLKKLFSVPTISNALEK
jgi:hypothetical protein